jgi:CRP-like cAMP-binding protein
MSTETKYWYLHNHKLFKNLNSKEVEQLCIKGNMMQGKKDQIIYLPSDLPRIYILKKGTIKIMGTNDAGDEVTKDIIQEGDIFGEISLGEAFNETNEFAQALSNNVIICSFLVKDFESILIAKPELSLQYTKWVGLKLTRMSSRYKDLIYKDVKDRLHNFIIELGNSNGNLDGNIMNVKNFLTQKDIAGIIGATRQTVATLIGKLESDNKIVYGRKEILILDWINFKQNV